MGNLRELAGGGEAFFWPLLCGGGGWHCGGWELFFLYKSVMNEGAKVKGEVFLWRCSRDGMGWDGLWLCYGRGGGGGYHA